MDPMYVKCDQTECGYNPLNHSSRRNLKEKLISVCNKIYYFIVNLFHSCFCRKSEKNLSKGEGNFTSISKDIKSASNHEAFELFKAIDNNDLKTLKNALKEKHLNINARNADGIPLLIYAVEKKSLEFVEFLTNQQDLDINATYYWNNRSDKKFNALHKAVIIGSPEIVSLLLKKGIQPNIIDVEGRAPIHYAIHANYVAVFEELIASPTVDLNLKDAQEGFYSPFLFCICRRRMEMLEKLISRMRAVDFNEKDRFGNNPFHLLFENSSITSNFAMVFKLLFEKCPPTLKRKLLNEKGADKKTPYQLGLEALKLYEESSLTGAQQKTYNEMKALFEQLNPDIE